MLETNRFGSEVDDDHVPQHERQTDRHNHQRDVVHLAVSQRFEQASFEHEAKESTRHDSENHRYHERQRRHERLETKGGDGAERDHLGVGEVD